MVQSEYYNLAKKDTGKIKVSQMIKKGENQMSQMMQEVVQSHQINH